MSQKWTFPLKLDEYLVYYIHFVTQEELSYRVIEAGDTIINNFRTK